MVMSMKNCNLCPRNCGVDRSIKKGVCNSSDKIKVARASLHMWEEPCISGNKGSGAVFFSGCSLRCVYCQNSKISGGITGKEITQDRLAEIFFELKHKGAANINLVTGDHYIPQITKALVQAKESGLDIPVILNTSSYVNVDTLKMLDGLVDVYLPDFKYFDEQIAKKYSCAPDYPKTAMSAIKHMYKVSGKPQFQDGYITKGVIVRHLVLPNNILNSKKVIKYLSDTYGNDIYISIMSQYTPCTDLSEYPEINRKITKKEYSKVVDFAIKLGLSNAFVQEGECARESFIPQFDLSGV